MNLCTSNDWLRGQNLVIWVHSKKNVSSSTEAQEMDEHKKNRKTHTWNTVAASKERGCSSSLIFWKSTRTPSLLFVSPTNSLHSPRMNLSDSTEISCHWLVQPNPSSSETHAVCLGSQLEFKIWDDMQFHAHPQSKNYQCHAFDTFPVGLKCLKQQLKLSRIGQRDNLKEILATFSVPDQSGLWRVKEANATFLHTWVCKFEIHFPRTQMRVLHLESNENVSPLQLKAVGLIVLLSNGITRIAEPQKRLKYICSHYIINLVKTELHWNGLNQIVTKMNLNIGFQHVDAFSHSSWNSSHVSSHL